MEGEEKQAVLMLAGLGGRDHVRLGHPGLV